MSRITEFETLINNLIATQDFDKKPERLYAPIDYVMSQKGKRIRPVMALLACELFDGVTDDVKYPALRWKCFTISPLYTTISWTEHLFEEVLKRFTKNGIPILPSFRAIRCLPLPTNTP